MTATIFEQEVDTTSIHALDFEHRPACEYEGYEDEPCGRPADYYGLTTCCGVLFYICEDCLFVYFDELKKEQEDASNGLLEDTFFCSDCGHEFDAGENGLKIIGRI